MNVVDPQDIRVRLDYMNVNIGGYIGEIQAISVKYTVCKTCF